MDWDCEFFVPKNNVFRKQWMCTQEEAVGEITNEKNKFAHCSGCNEPIGILSTMLYEFDDKRYRSKCHIQIITNSAP